MFRKSIYILLFGLLPLLSLLPYQGTCYGSPIPVTYQISPEELHQFELNLKSQEILLTQLESELKLLKLDSSEAKNQLIQALNELKQSRDELQKLKTDLEKSDEALKEANQLFDRYEKEAKRTQSRLNRQKDTYAALLLLAFGGAAFSR